MSILFDQGIGQPKPDFFRNTQIVAVLSLGYCSNDYTLNGKNNIITRSEEIDHADWQKNGGIIVTANAVADPSGAITAEKLEDASVTQVGSVTQTANIVAAGNTVTFSVWLRADSPGVKTRIGINDSTDSQTGFINPILDKQWRRYSITKTFTGAATGNPYAIIKPTANDLIAEVGICYAWGAQFVEGSLPLRYQKTTSVYLETSQCHALDQGDGKRCHHAFQSCQDVANFDANQSPGTVRKWAFCLKKGYLLQSSQLPGDITMIRPYIIQTNYLSQKIVPETSVTQSSSITLTMHDDYNPGPFDSSKTLFNTNPNGSFWRLWVERYRNFPFRRVEIWLVPYPDGVIGDDVNSPAKRLFTGIIDDISFNSGGTVEIICKDTLKLSKTKVPSQISADNVLKSSLLAVSGTDVTISIARASEITDPTSIPVIGGVQQSKVSIRIGDASPEKTEILIVKSRDLVNNTIVVDRAQYGSAAQVHPVNSKIREIIVYRNTVTPFIGFNPIDIELDLLLRSGIAQSDIAVSSFTNDKNTWLTGKTMSRIIEGPEEVEMLLREIRQLMFSSIWVDQNQQIKQRLLAPNNPAVGTLIVFSDKANIIARSLSVAIRDVDRINRVMLWYDPKDFEAGTQDVASFQKAVYAEDTDATNLRNYGKTRPPLLVYSKWFTAADQESAFFFAKKIIAMNKNGVRRLKFDIDLKDSSIQVGDSIKIDSRDMIDSYGSRTITELFIVGKFYLGGPRYNLESLSMRDKSKYGIVAPNGTPKFTDATSTAEQKAKYVFIGNSNNRVGNGTIEGYKSW